MSSPVIECVELTKAYGKRIVALNNLTLTINEGASFGLLGENGAGKSTLVRLLMGFIFPTSGRVRVLGEEKMARAHPRIGYVHERPIFETRFKGRVYLTYLGELSGLWGYVNKARVDELLERVNLYEAADRAIGTYSKGMLQRLAIAQALLSGPELLILDEPTSGLDPRSQWEVRQIISALRKQGKTGLLVNCIIISTLTVVLSVPMATRRVQIVFLAWLVAMLYSNSNLGPAAGLLAVSRIPLAPLAACYNLGATGTMSRYGLLMLALAVGYVVGLALLAEFWLARRDLLLQ